MSNVFRYFIFLVLVNIGITYSKAYDFEADGIYYNINIKDKTATVTWGGEYTNAGTASYVDNIEIPSSIYYSNQELPVVTIGASAFSYCRKLKSIIVPNSVNEIQDNAFVGCEDLENIIIPNSVVNLGNYIFKGCENLISVNIPSSIQKLPDSIFDGCTNLISIEIPNSITSLGWRCFADCENLITLNIPYSVEEIEAAAFSGCINLTSVNIPPGIKYLEGYTFKDCKSLSDMELPHELLEIKDGAFSGCNNIESIIIPSSVTKIRSYAFDGYTSLKKLIFEDNENKLQFEIFWSYETVTFKDSPIEELYLGRNVEYIDQKDSPFAQNNALKKISLGKYVKDAESLNPINYDKLEIINCYNNIPPKINEFSKTQYTSIIVNIPFGSIIDYQEDEVWGNFWNLQETLPNPNILAEKIILNIEEAKLSIGETIQLDATVLPEEVSDKTIIWTSSNENVASVSAEGLVTAISPGKATITATCGDVIATCDITIVEDAGVESLLVNPDSKISVYSVDGVLIKKDGKAEDLKSLAKGIYIIVSGKDPYKISI